MPTPSLSGVLAYNFKHDQDFVTCIGIQLGNVSLAVDLVMSALLHHP